jgi:hypothetical protein
MIYPLGRPMRRACATRAHLRDRQSCQRPGFANAVQPADTTKIKAASANTVAPRELAPPCWFGWPRREPAPPGAREVGSHIHVRHMNGLTTRGPADALLGRGSLAVVSFLALPTFWALRFRRRLGQSRPGTLGPPSRFLRRNRRRPRLGHSRSPPKDAVASARRLPSSPF